MTPDIWQQHGVIADVGANSIYRAEGSKRVLKFSDIRISSRPADPQTVSIPAASNSEGKKSGKDRKSDDSKRVYSSGEPNVWDELDAWETREPGFLAKRTRVEITKRLMKKSKFRKYSESTVYKYIGTYLKRRNI